jgi:hypothetical protein
MRPLKKGLIKPDYTSFVGVLFACKYFAAMTEVYDIKSGM